MNVARLISLALVYILSTQTVLADLGCNIEIADWNATVEALKVRNYYETLKDGGYCVNRTTPGILKNKYGSCTSTLDDIVPALFGVNCRTFMQSILYDGEGISETVDSVAARSIEICANQFQSTVSSGGFATTIDNYLCNPLRVVGCPRQLQIFKFAIFTNCHKAALENKTHEYQVAYFANNRDKACMIANDVCVAFVTWTTCPLIVAEIFDFIDATGTFTCANMFPTVEDRCLLTYEKNNENYCPPPTFFQKNIYSIMIPSTVGPVLLLLLFLCYKRIYRAQHISSDEVLKQAQEVDPIEGTKIYHPELAAVVASKYKGVTFNPATGEWAVAGQKERFQDEQAAARFAYLNLAGLPGRLAPPPGFSRSSTAMAGSRTSMTDYSVAAYQSQPEQEIEYVVTSVPPSPEVLKAKRLQELVAFYEFWEPTKPDIATHAENLLARHDFEHVARAIKTKYGVLPPGWQGLDEV